MQKEMAAGTAEDDEELCDLLIAISVVAKRLAKTIRENKEDDNVQDLWPDGKNRQS